jgi:hypothetical protein
VKSGLKPEMVLVEKSIRISQDYDPKALILDKLSDQTGFIEYDPTASVTDRMQPLTDKTGIRVSGPDYLLAIYDRAGQKIASGLSG